MKKRPDFNHTYHHIVIKGLDELPIFNSEQKRNQFLEIMEDVHESHDLSIYAFDFVDTHTHQFIRRNNQEMARFYQRLKKRYTRWYNQEFGREGTIYGGRYFNTIVDSEEYFQSVWIYVQNQGKKAGLYEKAEDSPWSTAGLYTGDSDRFDWIDWEEALDELDVPEQRLDEMTRVDQNDLVRKWLANAPPRKDVRNQHFIADEDFIERYMQIRKSEVRENRVHNTPVEWSRLIEICTSNWGLSNERILKPTKAREVHRVRCGLAYAGRKFAHMTTSEIAEELSVSQATVSRMIQKAKNQFEDVHSFWNKYFDQ